MKKIKLVAFLVGLMALNVNAQVPNRCSYVTPRQTDNWFFYFNGGIKFTDAGVQLNNIPAGANNLSAGNSCAVLSDENGELLLYSNGIKVFNKDHENITNGPNLAGDPGAAQSSLIIQNPVVSQMLYVFTTDQITNVASSGLNVTRVDLSAMSGRGSVMELNTLLYQNAAPMLAGVKAYGGTDYWVMTHSLDGNEFYAYKVDANGVNTNPVISSAGASISSALMNNEYLGTMKFSPQGDKVAFSSYGLGTIQVFSFDNASGKVGSGISIPVTKPTSKHGPYSIEFSPNGKKLYVTSVNLQSLNGDQNTLYQYDLANGNIETALNSAPGDDVMSLQLGRDGKVYVLRRNHANIGIIENPNRSGIDCNYNEVGFTLDEARAFNGLPNFVSSFLNVRPLDYDTKCDGDETQFTMLNTSNIDNVDWNFGDTASGANNTITSGPTNPVHTFSGPGTYTVTYTENYGPKSWTDTMQVIINPLPPQSFPFDSAYIVEGSSLTVYGAPDMYSYYWQDGSTNIAYTIDKEGVYTVLYEDMNCCQTMDTLTVTGLQIKVPSAFSPDNNGLNETFGPIGPSEGVIDYSFTIFNKWGQMVFETNNFNERWDGKIGSTPVSTGIYNWYITLNVPGNQMNNGKVKLTGVVMLFR